MWWALLWGCVIAGIDVKANGGGGFLAFLVIWYFADRFEKAMRAGEKVETELQKRIDDLKLEARKNRLRYFGEENT